MYIFINYRPDIQFEVHQCARFTHNLSRSHAETVKRIFCYLVGIQGQGLDFNTNINMNMDCYMDAYFVEIWKREDCQDPVFGKSRTGYVMNYGGFPWH